MAPRPRENPSVTVLPDYGVSVASRVSFDSRQLFDIFEQNPQAAPPPPARQSDRGRPKHGERSNPPGSTAPRSRGGGAADARRAPRRPAAPPPATPAPP